MISRFGAVIPAYNELGRIRRAVLDTRSVLGEYADIIVVDDGSTDATAEEARTAGARVIAHEMNRGKGAAVKTGALASTSEWILVLDADLSAHPSMLARFLSHIDTHDIVFGSRRTSGAMIGTQQPWFRVKAGQLFNAFMRAVTGLPYRDTQCGFKAYRMEACRKLFEQQAVDGWAFDVELLVQACRRGLRIAEVPVEWSHVEESKVRLAHGLSILRDLWMIRRNRT